MIIRVMRKPRPKKPALEQAGFTRCTNCVTKKKCEGAGKCLYGKKTAPKRNERNGRVSVK